MVTYITTLRFTEQGLKSLKDSPKRLDAYIKAAKAAGVKTVGAYYTLGEADLVLISEAPDEATLMKVMLNQMSFGNVTGNSMRAFTVAQMKEFVKE